LGLVLSINDDEFVLAPDDVLEFGVPMTVRRRDGLRFLHSFVERCSTRTADLAAPMSSPSQQAGSPGTATVVTSGRSWTTEHYGNYLAHHRPRRPAGDRPRDPARKPASALTMNVHRV
jgi:hypothetical protein